jgi:hypothetical protein
MEVMQRTAQHYNVVLVITRGSDDEWGGFNGSEMEKVKGTGRVLCQDNNFAVNITFAVSSSEYR